MLNLKKASYFFAKTKIMVKKTYLRKNKNKMRKKFFFAEIFFFIVAKPYLGFTQVESMI